MFFKHNLYALIWAIIIMVLTLTPGHAMPATGALNIPNSDKIAHFFVFFVFAYLLVRGFSKQFEFKFLTKNSLIIGFLISIGFGIIIEIIQTTIPGRDFDVLDILANTSGIILAISVFYLKDK